MHDLVFFSELLALLRLARMRNALVDSDRSASDLIQQAQGNVSRSLWSDTLCKNERNDSSLIDYTQSHTAHDVGKNLHYAGAVVCNSTPSLCGLLDRCCARSEGEPRPHHIVSR